MGTKDVKEEVGKVVDKIDDYKDEEFKPFMEKIGDWIKGNGKKFAFLIVVVFLAIIFGVILAYVKL